MTNANTPPGDALSESELSEIESNADFAYYNFGIHELDLDSQAGNDLRRLIAALRRARAENEALRSALPIIESAALAADNEFGTDYWQQINELCQFDDVEPPDEAAT